MLRLVTSPFVLISLAEMSPNRCVRHQLMPLRARVKQHNRRPDFCPILHRGRILNHQRRDHRSSSDQTTAPGNLLLLKALRRRRVQRRQTLRDKKQASIWQLTRRQRQRQRNRLPSLLRALTKCASKFTDEKRPIRLRSRKRATSRNKELLNLRESKKRKRKTCEPHNGREEVNLRPLKPAERLQICGAGTSRYRRTGTMV